MELLIMGRVIGADELHKKMDSWPGIYHHKILSWLMFENEKFIGTRKSAGAMRNKLLRKQRWIGGLWENKVVHLLKGRIVDALGGGIVTHKTINAAGAGGGLLRSGLSMVLQMGVLYRNRKKIHEALEFLEEGGNISSEKYMPVPVKGSMMTKAYGKFQHWMSSKILSVAYRNGVALYFLNKKATGEKAGKLVFVGLRRASIKWQMLLKQSFEARRGAIVGRGIGIINEATKKAQNG